MAFRIRSAVFKHLFHGDTRGNKGVMQKFFFFPPFFRNAKRSFGFTSLYFGWFSKIFLLQFGGTANSQFELPSEKPKKMVRQRDQNAFFLIVECFPAVIFMCSSCWSRCCRLSQPALVIGNAKSSVKLVKSRIVAKVAGHYVTLTTVQEFQTGDLSMLEPSKNRALYMLPSKVNAQVTRFHHRVGGVEHVGVVMEKQAAKAKFEVAVAQSEQIAMATQSSKNGTLTVQMGSLPSHSTVEVMWEAVIPLEHAAENGLVLPFLAGLWDGIGEGEVEGKTAVSAGVDGGSTVTARRVQVPWSFLSAATAPLPPTDEWLFAHEHDRRVAELMVVAPAGFVLLCETAVWTVVETPVEPGMSTWCCTIGPGKKNSEVTVELRAAAQGSGADTVPAQIVCASTSAAAVGRPAWTLPTAGGPALALMPRVTVPNPASLPDLPLHVTVLADNSGSMRGASSFKADGQFVQRLRRQAEILRALAKQLKEKDDIRAATFGQAVTWMGGSAGFRKFDAETRERLGVWIEDRIHGNESCTYLLSAVESALERLNVRPEGHDPVYHVLFLVTDYDVPEHEAKLVAKKMEKHVAAIEASGNFITVCVVSVGTLQVRQFGALTMWNCRGVYIEDTSVSQPMYSSVARVPVVMKGARRPRFQGVQVRPMSGDATLDLDWSGLKAPHRDFAALRAHCSSLSMLVHSQVQLPLLLPVDPACTRLVVDFLFHRADGGVQTVPMSIEIPGGLSTASPTTNTHLVTVICGMHLLGKQAQLQKARHGSGSGSEELAREVVDLSISTNILCPETAVVAAPVVDDGLPVLDLSKMNLNMLNQEPDDDNADGMSDSDSDSGSGSGSGYRARSAGAVPAVTARGCFAAVPRSWGAGAGAGAGAGGEVAKGSSLTAIRVTAPQPPCVLAHGFPLPCDIDTEVVGLQDLDDGSDMDQLAQSLRARATPVTTLILFFQVEGTFTVVYYLLW
jgi:hypothetical protein